MSHIVTLNVQVKDATAVRGACQRLNLPAPVQGKTKLFSGEVTGLAVQLPDWVYPVVCDTASGQIKFDNFGGRWGPQEHLDRFLQAYAIEKCRLEARTKGHAITEQKLAEGVGCAGSSHSRSGSSSRLSSSRIDRGLPGSLLMKSCFSSFTTMSCTAGGETRKYFCMSSSDGACRCSFA